MHDEEKRTENPEAHDSRTGRSMPGCCGPMVERMFRDFGETAMGASNGESARDNGADWFRSCASMMERMSSDFCDPTPREEEAKK
ncbi:MAG: hypothetical protein GY769_12230 [bacterium]|nr:hypothetical protein [bacterium]